MPRQARPTADGLVYHALNRGRQKWVHTPLTEKELLAVRRAVTTGCPYGTEGWVAAMAKRLGLDLAPRPRGRPRKEVEI
jgi:hypothetical protein